MSSFSKHSLMIHPTLRLSTACMGVFLTVASAAAYAQTNPCPAGADCNTTMNGQNGVNGTPDNTVSGTTVNNGQSGIINNGTVGNTVSGAAPGTGTGIGGTSVGTGNTVSGMAPNTNANGMVNTGSTAGIHPGGSTLGTGIGGTAGAHR